MNVAIAGTLIDQFKELAELLKTSLAEEVTLAMRQRYASLAPDVRRTLVAMRRVRSKQAARRLERKVGTTKRSPEDSMT